MSGHDQMDGSQPATGNPQPPSDAFGIPPLGDVNLGSSINSTSDESVGQHDYFDQSTSNPVSLTLLIYHG